MTLRAVSESISPFYLSWLEMEMWSELEIG